MYIEQIYTSCLSEAAYFIESKGEAIIIDPLRDVDTYINMAAQKNATIKYIFETHFHADFVSGHIDLAAKTGAKIVYGPNAHTKFECINAKDGDIFTIGNIAITVLHTPGHTMESTCYLLKDEASKDHCIFTGDTLFIGDVGRPDLSQQGDITKEELAGILYDSLQRKIIPLANDVIVYPGHGAGSSCGKNLSKETHSTIGVQKQLNYALQPQTKEDFIKVVTEGLDMPPAYFPVNATINRNGYDSLDNVLETAMKAINVDGLETILLQEDVILLDTRPSSLFTQGFIPGSIFIGLEGRFAEWAGSLLPFNKRIIIVAEENMVKDTAIRLSRVGLDNVMGYVKGGFDAWQQAGKKIDIIIDVDVDEFAMDLPFDDKLVVLDVRKEAEYGLGHVKGAENLPLHTINDPLGLAMLNDDENYYVHCQSGYRSVIALSMLKKQGYHNVRNIIGGWNAIKEIETIPTEKDAAIMN
jgi:hydroxyacylglutathione hydrolase